MTAPDLAIVTLGVNDSWCRHGIGYRWFLQGERLEISGCQPCATESFQQSRPTPQPVTTELAPSSLPGVDTNPRPVEMVTCPACGGNGETHRPCDQGSNAHINCTPRTCGVCEETGQVPAADVADPAWCDDCGLTAACGECS